MTALPGPAIQAPSYPEIPSAVLGLITGLAISVALWALIVLMAFFLA